MGTTSERVMKVAEIIAERDGILLRTAIEMVEETLEEIAQADYDPVDSEEIWMDNLGLEPDYLFDCLMM